MLGLVLLSSVTSDTITLNSQVSIMAFAAVFGYAQQAFTRLIDNKVDVVRKAALPPSTRTPLELSATQSSSNS